ncbi:MAG: hypothetical protein ACK4FV_03790 [Candidatus Nitrosocaldus sp.]
MNIEVEFSTKSNDRADILSKIAQLARAADELGLSIKEIEFEEVEEKEEEESD